MWTIIERAAVIIEALAVVIDTAYGIFINESGKIFNRTPEQKVLCIDSTITIKEGRYSIDSIKDTYLITLLKEYKKEYLNNENSLVIEEDFCIQKSEVSVGNFNNYLKSANVLIIDKENDLPIDIYDISDNDDMKSIITNINQYTNWLSENNKKNWSLPTVKQWLATVIQYSDNISKEFNKDKPDHISKNIINPVNLYDNFRELSITPCNEKSNNYLLLGQNYMTLSPEEIYCTEKKYPNIGFRLVYTEKIKN